MSQDIEDFVAPSCDLLALGEPTHGEPAFALIRNEVFARLAKRGFRSIALESDRVAAFAVNDFVQEGVGTLDEAMGAGFSHEWGERDANRRLVAWMREYNENRPAGERLTFHGFDAQMENMSAPSPRMYVEYARDYLGVDHDIAGLVGDDERWSRTEAVLYSGESVGATVEAERLRAIAADMLVDLHARAEELIAATSRAAWSSAKVHLMAGLGLLRYHKQCAQPVDDQGARIALLGGVRDALMARNLLDIRHVEAGRGPTLVFAHNLHLRQNVVSMRMNNTDLRWWPVGAIVGPMLGEQYTFVVGSLGRSEVLGLDEPEPDTYEGRLQNHTWSLTKAAALAPARTRTDTKPQQGYFPLDQETIDTADAILHVSEGTTQG